MYTLVFRAMNWIKKFEMHIDYLQCHIFRFDERIHSSFQSFSFFFFSVWISELIPVNYNFLMFREVPKMFQVPAFINGHQRHRYNDRKCGMKRAVAWASPWSPAPKLTDDHGRRWHASAALEKPQRTLPYSVFSVNSLFLLNGFKLSLTYELRRLFPVELIFKLIFTVLLVCTDHELLTVLTERESFKAFVQRSFMLLFPLLLR